MGPDTPSTLNHITEHILSHLQQYSPSESRSPLPRSQPLFVAIQGPQGSGKTYLTSLLARQLSSKPHNLKLATLSLDDIYPPHSGLTEITQRHPGNRLLAGRGLPGTHDLELGINILEGLQDINYSRSSEVQVVLPIFDKSLWSGEGDRLCPSPTVNADKFIRGPLDVVIIEAWCIGFSSVSSSELEQRWGRMGEEIQSWCKLHHVQVVNEMLVGYEPLWAFIDVLIQINPPTPTSGVSPYGIIYTWRLEQEHNMKARNGGIGMTDEQVISFVDRYIPGYMLFSDGITRGPFTSPANSEDGRSPHCPPRWIGKSLRIMIDEERKYVGKEAF